MILVRLSLSIGFLDFLTLSSGIIDFSNVRFLQQAARTVTKQFVQTDLGGDFEIIRFVLGRDNADGRNLLSHEIQKLSMMF